jgi:hypothetical protein
MFRSPDFSHPAGLERSDEPVLARKYLRAFREHDDSEERIENSARKEGHRACTGGRMFRSSESIGFAGAPRSARFRTIKPPAPMFWIAAQSEGHPPPPNFRDCAAIRWGRAHCVGRPCSCSRPGTSTDQYTHEIAARTRSISCSVPAQRGHGTDFLAQFRAPGEPSCKRQASARRVSSAFPHVQI